MYGLNEGWGPFQDEQTNTPALTAAPHIPLHTCTAARRSAQVSSPATLIARVGPELRGLTKTVRMAASVLQQAAMKVNTAATHSHW